MQNIWYSKSAPSHSGTFIWEVMEYMPMEGDKTPPRAPYITFADGTYGIIYCYHFWDNASAEKQIKNSQKDEMNSRLGIVVHVVPEISNPCVNGCDNPEMHAEGGHDV